MMCLYDSQMIVWNGIITSFGIIKNIAPLEDVIFLANKEEYVRYIIANPKGQKPLPNY